MLDIHDDLSGDISHRLEPYSHQSSFEHFVQFFEAWGMDIPPDRTEALVQHLEAFPCAPPDERPARPDLPEPGGLSLEEPADLGPGQGKAGSVGGWLLVSGAVIPLAAAAWYVARRRSHHP